MSDRAGIPAAEHDPDAGVAWHHGDPTVEQRAATRSAVVVDRSNRAVVQISGPDRLNWLHQLTSQHFDALPPGMVSESLILELRGHVEHHFVVSDDGSSEFASQAGPLVGVIADTEPDRAGALVEYLRAMKFWSQVEVDDRSSELGQLTVLGPNTAEILTAAELPTPAPDSAVIDQDVLLRRPRWQGERVDLLVPTERLDEVWTLLREAGAKAAGSAAFEALRVERLLPRLGLDTDERTIPHEVGWIGHAVHMDKGCYRGQETVARVQNLGRPPRRMVLLHLDGSMNILPPAGSAVTADGRTVGRVGTAVRHHELGPIALALVKKNVTTTSTLQAGGPVIGQEPAEGDEPPVAAAIDPASEPPEAGEGAGKAAVRRLRVGG